MQVCVWDPCVVTLPAVCFRHVLWAVCSYVCWMEEIFLGCFENGEM